MLVTPPVQGPQHLRRSAPVDVENNTETPLMETLQESQVVTVRYPRLRAVQYCGEYNGSVHADLGAFLQMLVFPYSVGQSAESAV